MATTICATANGKCTLRAAIDQANASPGSDEIELPKGTLKLTQPAASTGTGDNSTGDLDVSESVVINGRGPNKTVIEQTVRDGVLYNAAPFAGFSAPGLILNGVTLTGGRVGGAGEGGGGGFRNDEFALFDNVVVRDNVAVSDADDDVPGGGIVSFGILGLSDTTVRDNKAVGRGDTSPVGGGILIGDGTLSCAERLENRRQFGQIARWRGRPVRVGRGCRAAQPRLRARRRCARRRQHDRRQLCLRREGRAGRRDQRRSGHLCRPDRNHGVGQPLEACRRPLCDVVYRDHRQLHVQRQLRHQGRGRRDLAAGRVSDDPANPRHCRPEPSIGRPFRD